ncbi:MAG: hypothetical protein ACRDLN_06130 [Solirubrobacteraceae bacterium]
MSSEPGITAARAYLAELRRGRVPVTTPPQAADGVGTAIAEPDKPPAVFAPGTEIRHVAHPLNLAPSRGGFDLRDRTRARVFGRLAGLHRRDVWASTADEECLLAFEHERGGWLISARSADDGDAIAVYHPGGRPGGDVWVAPDHWYTLRWAPFGRGPSWKLAAAEQEVLRVRPLAGDRHEIVMQGFLTPPVLLLLLVGWVAMAETVPRLDLIGGPGPAW